MRFPVSLTRGLLAALTLLAAGLGTAQAADGAAIRAAHKAAAEKYFAALEGVKLSGTVMENGSPGSFEAYFKDGVTVVRQAFGELVSFGYDGPEGGWAGSGHALSYQFEDADNPASATLSLLTGGEYLAEPHWSRFTFVDDVAGGYNFRFAPEGLPPADVVLYSDPAAPEYLLVMSVELRLSPADADSHTYRSFYYYGTRPEGGIYTTRETGRELDSAGETASFSEYTVERVEPIGAIPADRQFRFGRAPIGAAGSALAAPVDIPCDMGAGYFIVPVTFAGSTETWNFILDTGASASLFTPEAATAAGLVTSVKVPAHGHGSRVDFELGLCTSASLGRADADAAARAPLAGFPAARVSESNTDVLAAFRTYGVGGIMGISLLHQYVVTFDQAGSKLTLTPPHLFDGAQVPRPNVEFVLDVEDLLYLTARISDGTAEPLAGELIIDTGLQQQLAVLRETMEAHQLALPVVDQRNNTVLGGLKRFDYVKVPRLDIGPLTWTDVESSMTDDDKGTLSSRGLLGFLGVPFFYGTRVTIDVFNQRMFVRPLDQADMEDLVQQLQQLNTEADALRHQGEADAPEDAAAAAPEAEPAAAEAEDDEAETAPDGGRVEQRFR